LQLTISSGPNFIIFFIKIYLEVDYYSTLQQQQKLKNELRKCVAIKEQPHQWAACDVPKLKDLTLDYERKKD
jgi:hypothetical protein